ncbi:MAG: hypothetical protein RL139_1291 [Gemmatimonadota bacterium]|jgi:hypothetical protein
MPTVQSETAETTRAEVSDAALEDAELYAFAEALRVESDADEDAEAAGDTPDAPPVAAKRRRPSAPEPESGADADPPEDGDAPASEGAPPEKGAAKAKLLRFLERQEREHRSRGDYERRASELEAERRALAEAREQAAAAQRRAEEMARKFRESPIEAAREAGIDPEALVQGATRELSPEARIYAQVHGLERRLTETVQAFEARMRAHEEAKKAEEARYHEQARAAEERAFVSQAAEKAPQARLLFASDRALLREAYEVIETCRARGLPVPTNDEILEYIEYQAAREIARIRGSDAASKATPPAQRAQGGSLPSSRLASERRGGPRRYEELSADEQDAELYSYAGKVMREARTRTAAKRPATRDADDD